MSMFIFYATIYMKDKHWHLIIPLILLIFGCCVVSKNLFYKNNLGIR